MVRRLKVAVSGLGRMGARHALHFLDHTPRAELVAVFDPNPDTLAWARQRLAPFGVTLYADFDAMLAHPGGVEAVVVAGITTEHAAQTLRALAADKHVLCEKPLSTRVEVCREVLAAARGKPHLKVLCGFSRRFDASYRRAREAVAAGAIGRPAVVRSQTCDMFRTDDYFVRYAAHSGGIFVDATIHDIDLALWFFGADSVVKSVTAVGVVARTEGLERYGDVDNGVGVVEFWGGKIAYFFGSRIMAAGQQDTTEVVGTHGKLTVNANPQKDLVEIHETGGVRREVTPTYYERFGEAFVTESNEFTECVLDDKDLPFELAGAVQALTIGCALQESLRSGKKIDFDESGERIVEEKARL